MLTNHLRPAPATQLASVGYTAVKSVGTGRFGSVFQVQKRGDIGRMLVCKVVAVDGLSEKDKLLAEQEVKLMSTLDHKHVVKLHDWFRSGPENSLCMILDYCDGGDMRHAICFQAKHAQQFPEYRVMTWFTQILDGLRYVHANRVIHRDLKTSNIFLKGPYPFTCLLGDFGVSRILEETMGAAQTIIGTPYYLSPEVCRKEPYSYKSDIWSLGVCLYEITMLKMPFPSSSLLGLVDKIINSPFDPIGPQSCSPQLRELIQRLLSKDSHARPTASDLMRDEFVLQFSQAPPSLVPVTACPKPPSLRGRRTLPRPWTAAPQISVTPPTPIQKIEVPDPPEFHTATNEEPTVDLSDRSLLPGKLVGSSSGEEYITAPSRVYPLAPPPPPLF